MSVSQKLIYVNCSNQFCVVLKCFMQVVYIEKFEVDISHISVFNKICKKYIDNLVYVFFYFSVSLF